MSPPASTPTPAEDGPTVSDAAPRRRTRESVLLRASPGTGPGAATPGASICLTITQLDGHMKLPPLGGSPSAA